MTEKSDWAASSSSAALAVTSVALGLDSSSVSTGLIRLSEIRLTADAASVTFGSISQDYRNLVIKMTARGTNGSTATDIYMHFNSDTGSNYCRVYQYEYYSGASSGGGGDTGTSNAAITYMAAANAPSNRATSAEIHVFDYSSTYWHKNAICHATFEESTSKQWLHTTAFSWRSTAAITSIVLAPSSGNFAAGSVFSLYGEP